MQQPIHALRDEKTVRTCERRSWTILTKNWTILTQVQTQKPNVA